MTRFTKFGRIVFAVPFLIFGINHFIYAGAMSGMVPSFIPGGIFWIYLTGLSMIAAGVSMLIQKYTFIAATLLAVLLIVFVLTIHLPSLIGGNMMAMTSILKDLALTGGALMVAGQFSEE